MSERDDVIRAFRAAGHQLWTVGGALRDEILGLTARGDEDFATDATPDVVEAIARRLGRAVTTVGQHFGTVGVLLDGRWTEVTTFRGEAYGTSRWPDVTFGAAIEEDLARRDFTINALARNTVTGELLDLFGGRADIAARLVRAVGDPAARFREDPLRILRGLRFASQLDFAIEPATLAGMETCVALLASLSQERVTAELDHLLQGRNPARGLESLRAIGALPVVLPELAAMPGCEQNHYHQLDVWGHTLATVAAIPFGGDNLRQRRWGAFLHDAGKPEVRHRKPDGEWGFFRHEVTGAAIVRRLLDRLRMAHRDAAAVELLVRRHMDRPDPAELRQVRRFMGRMGAAWTDLIALKRADNASHTYDDTAYHDALEAACVREQRDAAEALRAESPLSGDDIIAIAGRPPGAWIRPIKARLSEMVLEGDLAPGDRESAARVARGMLGGEVRGPRSEVRGQRAAERNAGEGTSPDRGGP